MRIKNALLVLLLPLALSFSGCSQPKPAGPKLTLSSTKIPAKGNLMMHGEGFTPNGNASSHLKRPNGVEFPELPILADDKGEFNHEIETLLLGLGTHEVWVIDEKTGNSSNRTTFDVTLDQPPAK